MNLKRGIVLTTKIVTSQWKRKKQVTTFFAITILNTDLTKQNTPATHAICIADMFFFIKPTIMNYMSPFLSLSLFSDIFEQQCCQLDCLTLKDCKVANSPQCTDVPVECAMGKL